MKSSNQINTLMKIGTDPCLICPILLKCGGGHFSNGPHRLWMFHFYIATIIQTYLILFRSFICFIYLY